MQRPWIAIDRPGCDDRLRVVAFATQNSAGNAHQHDGLASSVKGELPVIGRHQLSARRSARGVDPAGAGLHRGPQLHAHRRDEPIAGATASAFAKKAASAPATDHRELLTPKRPTPAQREVPGLF